MIYILILLIIFLILIYKTYINNNLKLRKKIILEKVEKLKQTKFIDDNEFKMIPKYFLNLENHKDRLDNLNKQFEKYDIKNYHRIKAMNGNKIIDLNSGIIDNIEYENNYTNCNKIELAITLSHIKAIKKAYENNDQIAMIFEDRNEFTLVPFWQKKIKDIISDIPPDCDFFLLANKESNNSNDIKLKKLKQFSDFTGLCYLITKKGINKIIENHCEDNKIIFSKKYNFQNIIFDNGFMDKYNIYSYNISLFALNNFIFESSHQSKLYKLTNFININFCNKSEKVIEYYEKLI